MKKIAFSVFTVVLCMLLFLCGCVGLLTESEVTGTWKMTYMTIKMDGISSSQANGYDASEDNVRYTFSENGKGSFDFDDYSEEISWEIRKNTVVVMRENEEDAVFCYKGGKLILEEKEEGVTNIATFEKQ